MFWVSRVYRDSEVNKMHVIDIKYLHEMGPAIQCFLVFSDSDLRYPVKYSEIEGKAIINGHKLTVTGAEMGFGGLRYFFICPTCRDRKQKLILTNKGLSCKSCLGIVPRSLNRSKTDCSYYWGMAEKVARTLDPSFSIAPVSGNIKFPRFPDKPKGMHWKTYSNKYMKYKEYKEKGDRSWMGSVGGLR